MGTLGKIVFGIIIGIVGSIAVIKFPDMTKQLLASVWELMKQIVVYVKTQIG